MNKAVAASVLALSLLLNGCATGYKAKGEGTSSLGYTDRKVADNNYELEVFGNNFDSYERLEFLWHRRARELCNAETYKAELQRTTHPAKAWIVIIPVFWQTDDEQMPLVKGALACHA